LNVLRVKSIRSQMSTAEKTGLKKVMGATDLLLLGVGAIIGTGIFVLTGVAAATYAGPGLMLSFVVAGFTCAMTALAYAELSAALPFTGSAYSFAYTSLGEIFGWLVGWNLILEYMVAAGAVAGGWSAYATGILKSGGITIPAAFTACPSDGGFVNLPAVLIVLFITFLLVRGTKESIMLNRILVSIKLGVVFLFICLAGPKVNVANWTPFLPFGVMGVVKGASVIFFAYLGFDCIATAAEETRNPQKDMPIGILGALAVVTVLYIVMTAIMTGVVPYTHLNTPEPVAYVLRSIGYNFGSALVGAGAVAGLSTVLLAIIYSQTRIFFAMSRDGMIPASLCKIHPKHGTPYIMTIITGLGIAAIAGFVPIGIIIEMTNIGTFFAFAVVAIGALVLRKTMPDISRPFRCPAINIVVPVAVVLCVYLMSNLSTATWMRFGVWSVIGLMIYFFYSYKHSTIDKNECNENVS